MATPVLEVRRAVDRYRTAQGFVTTWHCFSSGAHYDPDNTHFGPLVTCDEHVVDAGEGFARHRHAGVVIVSWPLSGTLLHEDAGGRRTAVEVGSMQRLSAGAGIDHGEYAGADRPARFVQMALLAGAGAGAGADADADAPAYLTAAVEAGQLVAVTECATALGPATLSVVRPDPRGADSSWVRLPPHDRRFLFVVRGSVELSADVAPVTLRASDSVRIDRAGALYLRGRPGHGREDGTAEVLVWDLPS